MSAGWYSLTPVAAISTRREASGAGRSLFRLAKMVRPGGLVLGTGLVTSFTTFLVGRLFMGEYAIRPGGPGALRAAFGGGVHLALPALFATGLTAVLRSAIAVLSLLVLFILTVSFAVGGIAGGIVQYFPDRAGQLVLPGHQEGNTGPWTGLAVTAGRAAVALVAGRWALCERDV